jgi:hypothetical protein
MLKVVGVIFLGLGGLLTIGNYLGIAQARQMKTNFSCIPVLAGVFGSLGLLFFAKPKWPAIVPLFTDIGSMPMVLALIAFLLSEKHGE